MFLSSGYHIIPASVTPNSFKVLKPRLEDILVNPHTTLFKPDPYFCPYGRYCFRQLEAR
jgi:hypothetical protein